MRILFDSKKLCHKDPFGTLAPQQDCTLQIHIPTTVGACSVQCLIRLEDSRTEEVFSLYRTESKGAYDIFGGTIRLQTSGLYFYYFRVITPKNTFRLFKVGDDTNMEAGDLWQVSCIPADFTTPDWAKGATIYQVFPDRFCKAGDCDLTGKLEPYTVHKDWYEEVDWRPTPDGKVLNNDFYGGNFKGIESKLPYIASLGATILYLNPISKSFSSHRYDTGDYKTPDPMLGTEQDFSDLCNAAHALGIRIVLDGVYSHTGSDSLYFNREGHFPGIGAYQSRHSPYYSWYNFHHYLNSYQSWWNFDTLPTVKKMDPAFVEYIITGEDSVVAHWLRLGADGFRLDVVDELPDAFTLLLKQRIRQIKPDALLIGEVWEDASNKIAYGQRRRYFVDGMLDSIMNYPFRTAILKFIRGEDTGEQIKDTVMTILENYPPQVVACNMNLLGTHDTPRILTALVDPFEGSREQQSHRHLSEAQWQQGKDLLMMASFLQYTLPGCPSLYYADEAGMEGHKDPFNRRTYPWYKEDPHLLRHFRCLGKLRKEQEALRQGDIHFFRAWGGKLGFSRTLNGKQVRIYLNRSQTDWEISGGQLLYGCNLRTAAPGYLNVSPMGFCIVLEE